MADNLEARERQAQQQTHTALVSRKVCLFIPIATYIITHPPTHPPTPTTHLPTYPNQKQEAHLKARHHAEAQALRTRIDTRRKTYETQREADCRRHVPPTHPPTHPLTSLSLHHIHPSSCSFTHPLIYSSLQHIHPPTHPPRLRMRNKNLMTVLEGKQHTEVTRALADIRRMLEKVVEEGRGGGGR